MFSNRTFVTTLKNFTHLQTSTMAYFTDILSHNDTCTDKYMTKTLMSLLVSPTIPGIRVVTLFDDSDRIPDTSTSTNKIYSLTLLSTAMAEESAFHALSVLSAKCTVNVNSYSVVTTNYYDPCLMSFFFKCLIWSFHGWITWVQCLFVHKVASLQPANIKKHTATLIFNNKLIVKIQEIESV